MAHNPQAPQGPQGQDPAASTQMFRAFVDEGAPAAGAQGTTSGGPRIGLVIGIVVAVAVVAAVAWLAFG